MMSSIQAGAEEMAAMAVSRITAVEEHIVTERFLGVAHELDLLPNERIEVELTRTVENDPDWRRRLVDLDARLKEMDACGQGVALLSLNPPGVQPYKPSDAVPLAREFNDSLAEIVSRHPDRFAGLGTVGPQDRVASAHKIIG